MIPKSQLPPLPFPCTVKVHARAKRARLKVLPHQGLVVVIPAAFPLSEVPALLLRHETWIKQAMADLERAKGTVPDVDAHVLAGGLPCEVHFPHFGERWQVTYRTQHSDRLVLQSDSAQKRLLVTGEQKVAEELLPKLLERWLTQRAELLLLPELEVLAREHHFVYGRARSKVLHAVWGSCTGSDTITLNSKLLFLPDALKKHVMLHELTHTVHKNHSGRFWQTLAGHDPLWLEHREVLREGWVHVPAWCSNRR